VVVTLLLYLLLALVVVLQLLILSMTHGKHFTPQAYYRKKRRGANFVLGLASLVPRPRKETPDPERRA
jgi:hypothetical protein